MQFRSHRFDPVGLFMWKKYSCYSILMNAVLLVVTACHLELYSMLHEALHPVILSAAKDLLRSII